MPILIARENFNYNGKLVLEGTEFEAQLNHVDRLVGTFARRPNLEEKEEKARRRTKELKEEVETKEENGVNRDR